ncbi:MAG: DUF309 domain-containing protein [Proteobacteria bacterium]|nr:DUF309 domain-containing protein [Pseudomonadota bacterium]MBU1716588.1 DUF309 domain-containing protein [Pseudomonadota bacterium]
MDKKSFDPFEDRLSRDIRNNLSNALMVALTELDLRPVREKAETYLSSNPESIYRDYIKDRLARYDQALAKIKQDKINEPFFRALVLWDQELFFEVHELLETLWLSATGAEKEILQAMIRAAGMYIHLAHGNRQGAQKMADKALKAFAKNRDKIPPFPGFNLLLAKLEELDPTPPRLS